MKQRGFTLIELLVTIGVIGILIAILLPALAAARRSARDVVGLSNLRQLSVSFSNYAETYGGSMPFAPPGSTFRLTPMEEEGGASITTGVIWDLSYYWASLFHEVAPWREHFRTWVIADPRRDPDRPWDMGPFGSNGVPSFYYCRSMFARPALWAGQPVSNPASLLAPVRMSDVRFTSSKVILYDGEATLRAPEGDTPTKIAMLFVDSHAARLARSDASEPIMPATGDVIPATLHDTKDGAFGRDY